MANSRFDFHKAEENLTEPRFNRGAYIIVRIDGDKFHNYCTEHGFYKPNDKRCLDLMVESAKNMMRTYKGHIPLAYGHSDEFSFLIRCTSNILSRRVYKITSMLPVVFATYFNSKWDDFFSNPSYGKPTAKKYDAWFDARPKEYPNYQAVIDYFRWRQVDCHINNLYNTSLHALTGRYIRHTLNPIDQADINQSDVKYGNGSGDGKMYKLQTTPISEWVTDGSKFYSAKDASERLSKTVSSEKHEILFKDYKINYNNELEQFKKGTVVVDCQTNYDGKNSDPNSIRHFNVELIKNTNFWTSNSHIFDDHYDQKLVNK